MLSVLRRPRWVGLGVITLVLCILFIFLGRWQWHRHVDRRERNALITTALAAAPVPIQSLMTAGRAFPAADEYRMVSVSGTYDAAGQLLQRNPKGRSGYDVITPLVSTSGPTLLVDRGWIPNSTTDLTAPAADVTPPTGPVDAVVRLRLSETGDDRVAPAGQVYQVDVSQWPTAAGESIYPAYGELVEQDPPPPDSLELIDSSAPGLGPHLFYAFQWWVFAAIALFGFFLLAYRESQEPAVEPGSAPLP